MSTVIDAAHVRVQAGVRPPSAPVHIALLGVGQVGGALAGLLQEPELSKRFQLASGLVRDLRRPRPHTPADTLTASLGDAIRNDADVVVEALGGLEPARTLILEAIHRRLPVVTANKSLLAAHGDELLGAARAAGVPFRYEAAVLAGVPFLGTFANRPFARNVSALSGIVNGTTNFVLSQMDEHHAEFDAALADAQRRGYAEPDPANDVHGVDAAEKLCLLLRHFGGWSVRPSDLAVEAITNVAAADLRAAEGFDGLLKPVVWADWRDGEVSAFAGPAFVSSAHVLARVNGVQNAVCLRNQTLGDLFFAGAGAGPVPTAATLLDDVTEVTATSNTVGGWTVAEWKVAVPKPPATGWFVRLTGTRLPDATAIADLLSAYGVWLRRTSEPVRPDSESLWLLTHCCRDRQITDALAALGAAAQCRTFRVRVIEG
jgi:homoserine dehydrogenase